MSEFKIIHGMLSREILTGIDGGLRREVLALVHAHDRATAALRLINGYIDRPISMTDAELKLSRIQDAVSAGLAPSRESK